ncbi:hypothetical protein GCM10007880_67290 [Mesorhizobium amorphae]|nr:hypothetical protein GCM10007880_67290 [Mesorhizobium amorphae]
MGIKFGAHSARRLRRKQPSRNDVWTWTRSSSPAPAGNTGCGAVDQDGYGLDEIVQNRRNTIAAKRLLTRLLKKQDGAPKRMITDKLRSYGAARRRVMPASSIGRTRD